MDENRLVAVATVTVAATVAVVVSLIAIAETRSNQEQTERYVACVQAHDPEKCEEAR